MGSAGTWSIKAYQQFPVKSQHKVNVGNYPERVIDLLLRNFAQCLVWSFRGFLCSYDNLDALILEGHLRASLAGATLPLTRKPLSKAWAGCVLFSKITTIGAWPCAILFAVSNQVFLIEFDHTVHIPKLWLGISNIFNLGKAAGFATYPARPGNLLVAVWSVILQILEVKCRAIFESAGHVCTMHWRLMH